MKGKPVRSLARSTVGALSFLLWSGAAPATTLPPRLIEAVEAFDAARVHGDPSALNALLADDYLLLNGDGSEEDRQAFIHDYSDPTFKLDPFVIDHALVRIWPGSAIMGGVTRQSGTSSGHRFERCIRFNDVWSERRGVWKVAFTQVSAPPAGSCDRKATS